MGQFDIFDAVHQLREAGRPFCVATVLRTADVTSAKAGAKAAISADGRITGHLGGACVKRAVTAAATEALCKGTPQLIRVKPSDKVLSLQDEDGAHLYKSGCPSGGTVDLLIEPYQPPPLLAILGDTPIARAIADHAALLGYRVAVPDGVPASSRILRFQGTELDVLTMTERDFVVIASQGQNDLACLRAGLDSPARRISMVASRRKADALCAKLALAGVPADRLERLKSPAGLDLKGIDPQEIAVSVVAELVLWRNADRVRNEDPQVQVVP